MSSLLRAFLTVWCCGLAVISLHAQSLTIQNNELMLGQPVSFRDGSAEITEDGLKALQEVKEYLGQKTYITLLRVEGHVSQGKDPQTLSEQRALAACRWLVSQGVDCKRLLPVGFGDTKPMGDPGSNTRIRFVNAALKDHLIGGMPADGGGMVAGDPCH